MHVTPCHCYGVCWHVHAATPRSNELFMAHHADITATQHIKRRSRLTRRHFHMLLLSSPSSREPVADDGHERGDTVRLKR
jgi:hypothetical protein